MSIAVTTPSHFAFHWRSALKWLVLVVVLTAAAAAIARWATARPALAKIVLAGAPTVVSSPVFAR